MPFEKITINSSEAGERLDTFLSKRTGITRSQIKKLIENREVLVNDKIVTQAYKIKEGDNISINILAKKNTKDLIPEPIPIEILYKDDHLIVVNKPPSMVVYPAVGHDRGTLMNAIAYHCDKLANAGAPLRPGVVHRLDKDTSGVIVVALEDETYYKLVEQFKERKINKRYIALIYGYPGRDEGEIRSFIGRSASDRKKMSTRVKKGKEAITKWKILERFNDATLVEIKLGTGRTHQIRVHFSSIGHPVLGDKVYGKKIELKRKNKIIFPRQMLHASLLGFIHPVTGNYMEFSSDIPEDMKQKISELKRL